MKTGEIKILDNAVQAVATVEKTPGWYIITSLGKTVVLTHKEAKELAILIVNDNDI